MIPKNRHAQINTFEVECLNKSMAVNKETNNAVNIDWEKALPQLTSYAKNKLYKRVGPLTIVAI